MPTASGGLRGGNYATVYRSSYAQPSSSSASYGRSRSASRPPASGLSSSNATSQYRAFSRPLPAGPGPLDSQGRKLEGSSFGGDSRTRVVQLGVGAGSSLARAGPLKADHNARYTTTTTTPERTSALTKKSSRPSLDPIPTSVTIGSGLSGRRSSSVASLRISDDPPLGSSSASRYDSENRMDHGGAGGRRKSMLDDDARNARQANGGETGTKRAGGARYSARVSQEASPSTSGRGTGVRGEGGRRGSIREDPSTSKISSHSSNSSSSTNSFHTGLFQGNGKDREGGKVGLRNLGNTCFMNSVLQCLSNTQPLLEWCLSEGYTSDINTTTSSMKGGLVKAFASLMRSLWPESCMETYVSPNAFKTQIQKFAPRFMGYSQQDSQEFLRYLLEGIHEDVNRIKVKSKPLSLDDNRLDKKNDRDKAKEYWNAYLTRDNSRIVDIFVGQLKSELKFEDCGHRSVTFDPFWDLSLPIPKSGSDQSLDNCLRMFMKEEELEAEERPMCMKCKLRRSCTKSFSIQRFPRILVFHLKRFSQERYGRKLNSLVDFPVRGLDLSDYSSEGGQKVTYDLYAVSNHSGGVHSGHYTALCKNPYTGEWHTFNDTRVTGARCNQAVSSEAYLLFYELTSPQKKS
ncbi:hypothetical protein ACOMHN_064795 [Nucella lapillus]